MAFIDEIKIYAKAGDGGNGVVRWRKEKNREFGGPSGGNGGKGGNVYAYTLRDLAILSRYRTKKDFLAKNGEDGSKNSLHGAEGNDLKIAFPVGSIINNLKTGEKVILEKEGDKILLLSGGRGGRGNESFKSSTNRSPKEWTPGQKGEEAEFFIEVELIADIGLIGLPNAGKTSLLNELTRANAKVGAYPFTTLEPNLGEYFGYVIADIPGLIEGASKGKGLGDKFLRHIRRTKMLVHLISLENEDLQKAYKTIRKELKEYDPELLKKEEVIILTKTDLIDDPKELKETMEKMKKNAEIVFAISVYNDDSIKSFQDAIFKKIKK